MLYKIGCVVKGKGVLIEGVIYTVWRVMTRCDRIGCVMTRCVKTVC